MKDTAKIRKKKFKLSKSSLDCYSCYIYISSNNIYIFNNIKNYTDKYAKQRKKINSKASSTIYDVSERLKFDLQCNLFLQCDRGATDINFL